MNSIPLKDITVLGDLGHRLLLSSMRLESDIYLPDKVYQESGAGWPADWEGRVLLALVRLKEATHREPSYMREIFKGVYERFNEKGYLGRILPDGVFDEQQLSGHNWLLRALLEYRRITGNREAEKAAEGIIKNLYMPLKGGAYKRYPVLPDYRVFEGDPDGCLTGDFINNWYLSTDIGCAYMCLDALSQADLEMEIEGLSELLEEMIEEFSKIDFCGLSMQTHATLSGIRGILRFYRKTKREEYLNTAISLFRMYLEEGITENYANKNWFERPFWTEPCGIVDSYMVATELFRITENAEWLDISEKIYYNALCYAQRPNGGFGCDNCAGAETPFISVKNDGGDAFWCCTMRGGEGLAEVAKNIAAEREGFLHITGYHNCEINYGDCKIEMITEYPNNGHTSINVSGKPYGDKIMMYIPSYVKECNVTIGDISQNLTPKNSFIEIEIKEDCTVTVDFDIPLLILDSNYGENCCRYSHGFVLLGIRTSEVIENISKDDIEYLGNGNYKAGEYTLKSIGDTYASPPEKLTESIYQIIFQDKTN